MKFAVDNSLTLNAPIATKVVCFSCLLKCLRSLYGNSVDPDQTAPIGAVCSGSMLFACILNLSLVLGNYLQQTTSADNIFRCIFFLGALRVKGIFGAKKGLVSKVNHLLFQIIHMKYQALFAPKVKKDVLRFNLLYS